jgi:hypothetical protein
MKRNGSSTKSYYSQCKRLTQTHVFFEIFFQDKLGTLEEFNFRDDEDEHNMENWKFWHLPQIFCQGLLKAPTTTKLSWKIFYDSNIIVLIVDLSLSLGIGKTKLCDLNQLVRSCTCALSQSMSSFSISGFPRFWMHIKLCCTSCERFSWKMVCPNTWLQLDSGTLSSWLLLLSDT